MNAATIGELRVECQFPVEDIEEFELKIEKNRHAQIHIKGSLPEKQGDTLIFEQLEGSLITVWMGQELLFHGLIRKVGIIQEGNFYGIVLTGTARTKELDYRKQNRSFQDVHMTYKEVIQTVLADRPETGASFQVKDQKITVPVYQMEETDWEFILRMASHMESAVVPSAVAAGIHFHVGLPQGVMRDTADAGLTLLNTWGDKKIRTTCLEIAAYANWEIGDRLALNGAEYTIISKRCLLQQGLLQFFYTLGWEAAFSVHRYGNPYLTGRLLSGRVTETKDEQVQVCFDMDNGRKQGALYWYPWHPEAGNIMYCMPEKGQKIYIRLDDDQGARAEGIYGVHENGEGNGEMNPQNRYFTTAKDKRMYMLPDTMGFIDFKQKSPLRLELGDGTGISLESHKKLAVWAKDTVGIKGKSVSLQAPQEISLVRRGGSPTVINMCNGFDSIGATNEVKMSGTGDASFPVFPPQEREKYLLDKAAEMIMASTPCCGFTDKLERQIEGSFVDKVVQTDEAGLAYFLKTGGQLT